MEREVKRIVIVGGGIAGLAAAYQSVKNATNPLEVTILEQADYWGGKIITEQVSGFVVEGGPDTFVVTKPWALELCRELGIDHRLKGTNPHQKNTYILQNDHLHPLPGGLTMMIPTEFSPMIRTGLLSWSAKFRMGMDFMLPPTSHHGDESLGAFVTRRLGREVYDNLIEPLMSGIYAGDGDKLSLQATFPYLRELEMEHGGLVKGALAVRRGRARRAKANGAHPGPNGKGANGQATLPGSRSLFLTPIDGLGEIVESLVSNLVQAGVTLRLGLGVRRLTRLERGYLLELDNGETLATNGVILATPAFVAGELLSALDPDLSAELNAIEYVSTATVSLAYRQGDLPRPLDGYGYVIPRRAGRTALACTWTSTKFPHRAPEGHALLRIFIGRAGQEDAIPWDEAGLQAIAQEELRLTLGITAEPELARVYRWENAMPQYNVGHPERLQRIDRSLIEWPGLALAGNGYQGIGIPDCIHSGASAAERVLAFLEDLERTSASSPALREQATGD